MVVYLSQKERQNNYNEGVSYMFHKVPKYQMLYTIICGP